jgi:hypothetical protein
VPRSPPVDPSFSRETSGRLTTKRTRRRLPSRTGDDRCRACWLARVRGRYATRAAGTGSQILTFARRRAGGRGAGASVAALVAFTPGNIDPNTFGTKPRNLRSSVGCHRRARRPLPIEPLRGDRRPHHLAVTSMPSRRLHDHAGRARRQRLRPSFEHRLTWRR